MRDVPLAMAPAHDASCTTQEGSPSLPPRHARAGDPLHSPASEQSVGTGSHVLTLPLQRPPAEPRASSRSPALPRPYPPTPATREGHPSGAPPSPGTPQLAAAPCPPPLPPRAPRRCLESTTARAPRASAFRALPRSWQRTPVSVRQGTTRSNAPPFGVLSSTAATRHLQGKSIALAMIRVRSSCSLILRGDALPCRCARRTLLGFNEHGERPPRASSGDPQASCSGGGTSEMAIARTTATVSLIRSSAAGSLRGPGRSISPSSSPI